MLSEMSYTLTNGRLLKKADHMPISLHSSSIQKGNRIRHSLQWQKVYLPKPKRTSNIPIHQISGLVVYTERSAPVDHVVFWECTYPWPLEPRQTTWTMTCSSSTPSYNCLWVASLLNSLWDFFTVLFSKMPGWQETLFSRDWGSLWHKTCRVVPRENRP